MLPVISCIVPVYNGERYLAETLNSIVGQTYRPLEIIVVDDGSTDGSARIAEAFGPRVQYCWQENAGEAAARNGGLGMAQTEFVAFLDADDLWRPEKLARQIAQFQEKPEIDLCFTSFENFWIPELAAEEQRYRGICLISTAVRLEYFDRFGSPLDFRQVRQFYRRRFSQRRERKHDLVLARSGARRPYYGFARGSDVSSNAPGKLLANESA
jgi:glycosyltransferase involved in cell wall biosynthesis